MISAADLAANCGRFVLFVGTEAYTWSTGDYTTAAKNARALGFDTICVKVADGAIKWYKDPTILKGFRDAVHAEGCGFLGFQYCYGPKFGNAQIEAEAVVAKEIAGVCGNIVVLDLEEEWNGNGAAAQGLANQFAGSNVDIILSTWADPVEQDWTTVVRALDPVVSAWGPQEYTVWLTQQEAEFTALGISSTKLFPAIDIADVFANSNPLDAIHNVVSHGHSSIWVWEYQALMANAQVIKTLMSLLPKPAAQIPVVATTPLNGPVPSAGIHPVASQPVMQAPAVPTPHTNGLVWANYTIHNGDSLVSIADRLGVANWQADLYVPNRATLDAAARANGQPSSAGGNFIYAGTVIKYPMLKSC